MQISFLFACYFAINGWFRVFVVATYLSICLTPKTLHTTVSHQNIIANNGVYERIGCITCTGSFFAYLKFCIYFRIVYACARIRNGRHCVSCRHICRSYNLHPHQQRCAYTISPPHITPIPFIHMYSPQTHMLSVTAGSVNPAAIYVVRTIYTLTNNSALKQHLFQT